MYKKMDQQDPFLIFFLFVEIFKPEIKWIKKLNVENVNNPHKNRWTSKPIIFIPNMIHEPNPPTHSLIPNPPSQVKSFNIKDKFKNKKNEVFKR